MTTSLIIPTYGPDEQRIVRVLATIHEQTQKFTEVIIVENGKKSDWLEDICLSSDAIYHFNEEPGANKARNIGARLATQPLLVFTDDDCLLDSDFLVHHLLGHRRSPNSVLGGQVQLVLPDDSPSWLREPFRKPLAEVDWHVKGRITVHGDVDLTDNPMGYLVTANLSITKEAFLNLGGFDEEAGYIGNRKAPNDEFSILFAARDNGMRIYYSSLPVVHHLIPKSRVTMEYMKHRFWGQGYADAMLLFKMNGSREEAISKCLDDIFRKGSIADQLNNEKFSDDEKEAALEFARNLYICTACYTRGVLDYFHEFEDHAGLSS